MEATAEAFRKHGYADLSIQKIADEFGSGKSLIYYRFDDKEDLMQSFLNYLKQEIEEEIGSIRDSDNRLDMFLSMALGDEPEMWEFRKALFELRGRAPYNQKFAEKFQEMDELLLEEIEQILEGRTSEPAEDSELVFSVIDGFVARKIGSANSYDETDLESIRNKIKKMIEEDL